MLKFTSASQLLKMSTNQKFQWCFTSFFHWEKQRIFQAMQCSRACFNKKTHGKHLSFPALKGWWLGVFIGEICSSHNQDQGSLIESRCHKNYTKPNNAPFIREIHQKYVKNYSISYIPYICIKFDPPKKMGGIQWSLEKTNSTQKIVFRGSVHKHRNKHNLAAHVAASRNVNRAQQHGQAHHPPPWLHMRLDF